MKYDIPVINAKKVIMESLYVDKNSRTAQLCKLSIGLNVSVAGVVSDVTPNQIVRIKAVNGDATIKLRNQQGDGVVISENETEYFFIDDYIELVSGEINIMY